MKYIKLYEELYNDSPESIEKLKGLLGKYEISDFEYEDGYIDSRSSVDLSQWELTEFPITLRNVFGDFDCSDNILTTLKNGPYSCQTFDCSNNDLTSLEFSPDEIMGSFICHDNKLTSLEHSPDFIEGDINFCNNPIHNFDGLKAQFEDDSDFYLWGTPIHNITGVDVIQGVKEFREFRERFEKAVDGKKVKLPLLKYLRHIYSERVSDLEVIVKRNGYEIV